MRKATVDKRKTQRKKHTIKLQFQIFTTQHYISDSCLLVTGSKLGRPLTIVGVGILPENERLQSLTRDTSDPGRTLRTHTLKEAGNNVSYLIIVSALCWFILLLPFYMTIRC